MSRNSVRKADRAFDRRKNLKAACHVTVLRFEDIDFIDIDYGYLTDKYIFLT